MSQGVGLHGEAEDVCCHVAGEEYTVLVLFSYWVVEGGSSRITRQSRGEKRKWGKI